MGQYRVDKGAGAALPFCAGNVNDVELVEICVLPLNLATDNIDDRVDVPNNLLEPSIASSADLYSHQF